MVKGIDQVNTEGFNKNTNLSIQEIKRILEGHFSELETLKDTHLHLFTSENREVSQTLLHEFSEEIIRIWGMPPYNEYLVDPRIAEDGVFDAFPHQKVGRPRNVDFQEDDELSTKLWKHINEDDLRSRLEKAIENKWPKFWSVDRVKQYFEKILSKKNSFISIVTDSEGRIVAWLIMYEVNPTELLGVNVIDNEGNIVEEAIYLDTSGFGYNYRLKENKPIKSEIEVSLASAFSKIAELTDGKVVGRSLIDDSKVAQAAQRILGFTTTSISPESDPSRVYSLKGDMRVIDEVTTEGKEFINVEDTYNGLLERFLSSTEILYIEQTLKDRIEGSHIKIKKLLLESIDKYLETTKISEEERETLEEYRTQINSGVLFQDLFERYRSLEGVTDLIIGGPGAILLSIYTYYLIAERYPYLLPIPAALEAIPLLGGMSSVYRAIYLLTTMTIPQSLKSFRKTGKVDNLDSNLIRSFGSSWDGGWIILPLLRDEKYFLLSKALISNVKSTVESIVPNIRKRISEGLNRLAEKY